MSGLLPRICAQASEEFGAVARQLLHTLGERDVQPLAEIGDLGLVLLVALLGGIECLLDCRELAA